MNIDEIAAEYEKNAREMAETIYIADGHIVVNVAYEYNIDLNTCRSYEQILAWTFHLTEKTWMSRDVLRHFIKVACHANNIDIPTS